MFLSLIGIYDKPTFCLKFGNVLNHCTDFDITSLLQKHILTVDHFF